ncbi:MAG: hypothetical protein GXC76_00420 [Rhodanobacteraceae bacterium]|jgi:hypothetical protein|nr:hypothetical protein [Rhodanobacteraceae bacterium]
MPTTVRLLRLPCLLLLAAIATATHARQGEPPYSISHRAKAGVEVPIEDVKAIDAIARRAQADIERRSATLQVKREQVADDNSVEIVPAHAGRWDTLDDGSRLWRVRVRAAGATDLRLGFDRFALPPGTTLHVIGADDYYQGPYTADDATAGGFNSPIVPGDIATVELRLPAGAVLADDAFELTSVGAGFRDLFGRTKVGGGLGASGACNVDVACPLGQSYPDQIRAVGHYEFRAADSQYYICTGTLLADVPKTRKSWFLTAAHCISSATEAASIVVYWNYQSTQCGRLVAPAGGYFNDNQTGAALRATRADVDFTLLELSATPQAAWHVYYAGWDANGGNAYGTIGLHHPSGDVKKITAGPATSVMYNCAPGAPSTVDTHWHAGPYSQGTTEGGSSGSGLFVVAGNGGGRDRRLIGTLTAGSAQCSDVSPNQPNNGYDCYGRLAVAWNGPSAASRLRDWLDPAGTGTTSIAGIDSQATPTSQEPAHSTRPTPSVLLFDRSRR